MILIIDNYDSFTFNLVQLVGGFTRDCKVIRNDKISIDGIRQLHPHGIIISPGPGRPGQKGVAVEVIRSLGSTIPILGVCLGHQAIGYAFGGSIVHAPQLMHGKSSTIFHQYDSLFANVDNPFEAGRYHSLVISPADLPTDLIITARTSDETIMAIRHIRFPIYGVQFHPESILTASGKTIMYNWLLTTGEMC